MECELDTVAQVHVAQQSRRDKLRIQHPSPVMANHLHQQPRQRQMMIRNDRNENGGEAVVAYEYDPTSDAAIFPNIPPPPPQEILNSNPLTVDQRWKFMASPHQISFSAASSPLNTYHHQQNQLPPSLMNFPHHQQPQHHRRQLYQNAAPITGNNQRCDDELVLLPSSSSSSSSSYNVTVAGLLDHNHLDFPAANISRSEGLLPHHNSSNHPQALALSLSSNQWNCREMKGLGQQFVDVSNGGLHNNHDRNSKPLMNMPFPPEIPHLEIEVQTASVHHNSNTSNSDNNNNMNNMNNRNTMSNRNTTGPLGPFTGYATILKSSGFLKPAQDLLDEFCGLTTNHKLILPKASDDIGACSGDQQYPAVEVGVNKTGSCLDIRAAGDHNGGGATPSPMSSSAFGATQICGEAAAAETSRISTDAWLPDFQQKKASLLHMKELVSRRYRQYKEQVQMVVSSFESVEGLSTAAPHVCASLKLLTRHFKWLKNAISSQLRHIGNALPSPSVEGDGSMSWRSFHSHRLAEPQQHLWRPQRGLPERSVAVLRAWLFDHFLHPYPTDTDKQMLATRAGLSRNQVSNWFINARVRLWKPMVEEIHMLETKGGSGEAPNPGRASKRTRMEREGGGAAVSLTLGLRNTAESSQQVQNLHFGGHVIGEFVG